MQSRRISKKGQVLEFMDFTSAILLLGVIAIIALGYVGAKEVNKENKIKYETDKIDSANTLLLFIRAPVESEGKTINMADLITMYYLSRKEEDYNKIRKEAEPWLNKLGGCWNLEINDKEGEEILKIGNKQCAILEITKDITIIEVVSPLPGKNENLNILLKKKKAQYLPD